MPLWAAYDEPATWMEVVMAGKLVNEFMIPKCEGRAFEVTKGEVFKALSACPAEDEVNDFAPKPLKVEVRQV